MGSGALCSTVADVADLPYPDGSVALVVSSLSLHHWPDPQAGLAEIHRILRPGGQAWLYDVKPQLATTVNHLDGQAWQARIEPLSGVAGAQGRVRSHRLKKWVGRLELE